MNSGNQETAGHTLRNSGPNEMEANNDTFADISSTALDSNFPVFMDSFVASGHLACALFGISINLLTISFIIVRLRLRRQPRNIIWIGICLSNIFVLFTNLLEPIGYYFPEAITTLCGIHFFLVGFPGAAFLMFNFLSLVDRYLSIFNSVWYRRCVTTRLVLGIQLTAFIVLFFLMKFHYIFGIIEVKCSVVQPLDRTIYIGFIGVFLILCLSGQLTVYIMIKTHLVLTNTSEDILEGNNAGAVESSAWNMQPNSFITTSGHSSDTPKSEVIVAAPEEAVRALGQCLESSSITQKNLHFIKIRDQMVSRLELEATRNVVLNVGIFLLFSLPWIISSVLAQICNAYTIHTSMSEDEAAAALVEQCSRHYWALSYTRLILLIGHSIYQFICYVLRSKDFCTGLCRERN